MEILVKTIPALTALHRLKAESPEMLKGLTIAPMPGEKHPEPGKRVVIRTSKKP
ncbi:hypothetical protein [Atlantibacter subterraneus]|uniref:hypothetical protein n=1 Tax=Atlantibacter subterraneus TaxID=255519 RepID=UPI0028ADDA8C|nr:hypothetical protein [Atlantibacter subterranea]